MNYKLSVVMIVKNEEENLKISLPAIVDWVDEIIILDSGSTDNSQKIAEKYNAKWFVNTDWQGFGKQRQLAQSYASGDWILALDADEEVNDTLKHSILQIIKQKPSNTIYGIKCLDFIFGYCIDNPSWRIKGHFRLYPNSFCFNDNLVHEDIILNGANSEKLKGFLYHHTAPTPYFWLEKRLQYALSWAKDRHQQGKKIGFYKILLNPLWAFFKQFIIDGRFLQGSYGFVYSLLFCQYTFNKYAILYDMNRQRDSYQADFQPHSINYQNLPKLPKKITHKTCTLSVVLIIKNEQKHLPACLYQIYDIADEIIILDSGSTDKSKEIADYFQAKWFVNTDWQGFGKQRQIAQKYATGDYILMIDPDELIDNSLKENILLLLKQKLITNKVFAIKYLNIFCGHKVYGKWYSDKIIRFYANRHFQYHDYDVHESVNFQQAKVEILNGYIQHFTNENLYHFILKRTDYSHDWAVERYKKRKNPALLLSLPLRAFFSFLREYILRGLCFGKAYGFLLAVSAGNYTFNKYLMLWYEHERKQSK